MQNFSNETYQNSRNYFNREDSDSIIIDHVNHKFGPITSITNPKFMLSTGVPSPTIKQLSDLKLDTLTKVNDSRSFYYSINDNSRHKNMNIIYYNNLPNKGTDANFILTIKLINIDSQTS